MKKLTFILVAICCLILTSCGKESKDLTLTPESASIRGDLKEYFTVVEKPYTIKYDEDEIFYNYMISIELKRTDVPFKFNKNGIEPEGYSGAGVRGNYGIGIDLIDAEGNIALSWSPTASGFSGVYSSEDLLNLFTLESGETGRVRWSAKGDDFKKYENKCFTFKVSSSLKLDEERAYSSSNSRNYSDSDDDEDRGNSRSSKEWDKVLDSYERYIDKYIAVLKKVNAGDMNAYSEMATLMEQCEELSDKLDDADDEMSATQLERYQKITVKLANAASQF